MTIAETATDVRLVAWITASQLPAVRIVTIPRNAIDSASTSAPRLSLEKRLLLRQAEAILDVAMLGNSSANQFLLILEASKLVLYRWQSDRWEFADAAQIPRLNPWPRDIRGEILDPERNLEIRLPGLLCKGTAKEKVILDCGRKPDPDGLTPGRNFYPAGHLAAGGEKGPPYFAGTDAQDGASHLELVSGTDGRMYVFRGEGGRVAATFSGWGSDMAGLDTECGLKRQVLAARATDRSLPDAIQAYEIHDDSPVAIGSPLEFSGPVMSLHRTADLRAAMAIVRNAETGIYEAYRITLACGN